MEGIRRIRDGEPLAALTSYVALQALIIGAVALPGAYDFEPSGTLLALQLLLVVLVARGSHLAWMLLVGWEVLGALMVLAMPLVASATTAELALSGFMIAAQLLSLWFLCAPSLRASVGDREPISV